MTKDSQFRRLLVAPFIHLNKRIPDKICSSMKIDDNVNTKEVGLCTHNIPTLFRMATKTFNKFFSTELLTFVRNLMMRGTHK